MGDAKTIRVFVNEIPFDVPVASSVSDAVKLHDTNLAEIIAAGGGYFTDGVGRDLQPDTELGPGDIIRAVASARGADRT